MINSITLKLVFYFLLGFALFFSLLYHYYSLEEDEEDE